MLDRAARNAEESRNVVLMASLLEQAAKEVGDSYTNKQKIEHAGKGGGPIRTAWTIKGVEPRRIDGNIEWI